MFETNRIPWFIWPFWALLRFIGFILEMSGRLVGALLGFVLFFIGVVLCMTVVGAIAGIPLALFGLLLIMRSLFD
jgi:hypothetical protein